MPRKKPFSGKQKKKQLHERRLRKQDGPKYLADFDDGDENENRPIFSSNGDKCDDSQPSSPAVDRTSGIVMTDFNIQKINEQPEKSEGKNAKSINNFRLHYFKDSIEQVERRKKDARKPLKFVDEKYMELDTLDVYPPDVLLDFPKRPPWSYSISKEKLNAQESRYFQDFIHRIIQQDRGQDLSYFEVNLETWRQLWRVLEMSDILLIISDSRYPVLHLPPSLVQYIIEDLHRDVVVVLNKIDFLPPVVVSLWKSYLESQFPGIKIILFSSFLKVIQDDSNFFNMDSALGLNKKPRPGHYLSYGPSNLLNACKDIVKDSVDLSSWKMKLVEDGFLATDPTKEEEGCHDSYSDSLHKSSLHGDEAQEDADSETKLQSDHLSSHVDDVGDDDDHHGHPQARTRFQNGVLTLGCIGFPNSGKSSVLNTLVGKKVVSVSQTPGHTKHFQTIFLTPTVKLCDCPGLVFPSLIPKSLQVIAGIYPVAHVKEPYSIVGYLAKRVNLPRLLHLQAPNPSPRKRDKASGEYIWSAYDICEAWACKNGFTTSKAGRPDIYRAANKFLRMAVDGQICLYFKPPNFAQNVDHAKSDPSILSLHSFLTHPPRERQSAHGVTEDLEAIDETTSSSDEDEDDDDEGSGEEDEKKC